jgi:DNA-binding NarL/FixJ family response regulator
MATSERIRILAVDDHPLMSEGLASVIRNQSDMLLVGFASCGREAVRVFRECEPDITLMDLRLPDMHGSVAMSTIRSEYPDARFIALTTFSGDVEIQRTLAAGAQAYMLKSMPPGNLVETIRAVHSGKMKIPSEIAVRLAEHLSDEALTVREVDVLNRLADGHRNRDIAEKLFIAEETVKVHLKHILAKLGAADRTQALAIGLRRGIIEL